MNQSTINQILPYGVSSVIIGILVAIIYGVAQKVLKNKLSAGIRGYFPFVTGILLNFILNLIFNGLNASISETTVYTGLFSGSLGTVIFTFIKKLKKGDVKNSDFILIIEELLLGVLKPEKVFAVSEEIKKIISENHTEEELLILVEQTVKKFSEINEQFDFTSLAELIIRTAKNHN